MFRCRVYLFIETSFLYPENSSAKIMENEAKKIAKKLLDGSLTGPEKAALLSRAPVERHIRGQWADVPDFAGIDRADGCRIWTKIYREIRRKNRQTELRFYQIYSLAASIALLLGLGWGIGFRSAEEAAPAVYIVSSGARNTEAVTLPDGTTVQIGAGSRLTYPERFSGDRRRVTLAGQAFFQVAADPEKPFVVHTSRMDVTAVGTAFEVFTDGTGRPDEAILLNGKIRVDVIDGTGRPLREPVYLSPDEKITVAGENGTVRLEPVDADKYTAWRLDGVLSFENERLSMILPRLERWYGCRIVCPPGLSEKYRFTFRINDESPERILYMLSQSSSLGYRKSGGRYELYERQPAGR